MQRIVIILSRSLHSKENMHISCFTLIHARSSMHLISNYFSKVPKDFLRLVLQSH
ncbi:uncharacterized protein LOC144475016 isoform X2 [Augochlora pura]